MIDDKGPVAPDRNARLIGNGESGEGELVYRFRWSVTQVAAVLAGIFLLALGGIGLARAGAAGITDPFTPEVIVGTWHRTPLMATLELMLGFAILAAAVQTHIPRGFYRFAGAIGFAFGLVLIAQPATFDSVLGASRDTGWTYALLGLVFLGLGFGSPIVFEREIVRPLDDESPSHEDG